MAVVTAGTGVAAVILTRGNDTDPSEWDVRVRDLATFVERERGLRFDHPVRVDFLPEAEFRREVTRHEALDPDERTQLESFEAVLRAVGLIDGDIDLEKAGEQLLGEGVVGFYRPEDERVLVRGARLDDERRATLVHELTHALQDQHFDIERETNTSGEAAALQAVVEADAVDVENAWVETLSADAVKRLDEATQSTSESAEFEGVPDVFVELMSFPYIFGLDFLHAVLDEKGQEARDQLFRKPPTTEEQIVRPETYLDLQRVRRPPRPTLRAGERAVADSEDDVGMLSLLVVLSERIDFLTAWRSLQGWAGDAMLAFNRGETVCIRAAVTFDDAAGAQLFAAAFDEWARGTEATQRLAGETVTFESCDPGTTAPPTSTSPVSGIQGLQLRKSFVDSLLSSGAPADAARCVTDRVMERVTVARLAELDVVLTQNPNDPRGQEVQAAVAEAAGRC
jgi:hypothetical protein